MFPAAPSGSASEKNPINQKKIARSLSPGDLLYILLGTSCRAGCPHPAARLRCASCDPPVGADDPVRPPGLYRISYNVSLRDQSANWSWQSASPVPMAPLPKGGWRGEAVTGGFLTASHSLQPLRRGGVLPRPPDAERTPCNAFVGADAHIGPPHQPPSGP